MRTRNLKPNFFKNDILGSLDPLARLLFSGLWCLADREGRLEDRPMRIKAEILPFDDCDIEALLSVLQENEFITRYASGGKKYIDIPKFSAHQHPNMKEAASVIPPPEGDNGAAETPTESENGESTEKAQCLHGESSPLNLKPQTLNPKPHSSNPKPKAKAAKPKVLKDDGADAVLNHFEKVTKLHFRDRKTPKALITKTLAKGFTPDELKKVIEKLNSEWKDTKYAYLLTPSYIFGDRFEELLIRPAPKEALKSNFTNFTGRDYGDDELESFCNRGFQKL